MVKTAADKEIPFCSEITLADYKIYMDRGRKIRSVFFHAMIRRIFRTVEKNATGLAGIVNPGKSQPLVHQKPA